MTAEGRLARGKENFDKGRFLDNQETIDYIYTLPENVAKAKAAAKEAADVRPNK